MVRLFVADDHPVVREGLKRIIADCRDMTVVGEGADGIGLAARVAAAGADVLLLDVSMPGPGVFELIRLARQELPGLRILVLSVQPEEVYAVRCLRAGAAGYLTKDHSPEELAGAIRRVHRGGRYVSPALAESLALGLEPDSVRPPHEALSNREYEVLCLLARGRTLKEIAAHLDVSPKSVSTYRARMLEKTGLRTTAELIRYALEHGISA